MLTVEEQLKSRILEEYKSIRAFALKNDFPYSTIDNIFQRGFGNLRIHTITKLCHVLNLDMEVLLNEGMVKEKKIIETIAAHHDPVSWTEEELSDIEDFKNYILSKRSKK